MLIPCVVHVFYGRDLLIISLHTKQNRRDLLSPLVVHVFLWEGCVNAFFVHTKTSVNSSFSPLLSYPLLFSVLSSSLLVATLIFHPLLSSSLLFSSPSASPLLSSPLLSSSLIFSSSVLFSLSSSLFRVLSSLPPLPPHHLSPFLRSSLLVVLLSSQRRGIERERQRERERDRERERER